MNIYANVKTKLNLIDVVHHYGIGLNRGRFTNCLYHMDRTPSMKMYSDHFHCYGCGKHGDIITLTEKIFSISPYAAAQKLSQDFYITHNENFVSDNTNIKQKSYAEKENHVFKMLNEYCHFLEECREKYKPKNPDEELHPLFVESLTNYEQYNYYRDIFITGTKEERIHFINYFNEKYSSNEYFTFSVPVPASADANKIGKRGDAGAVTILGEQGKNKTPTGVIYLPTFAASPAGGATPPRRAHDTFQSVAAKVSEWVRYFEKVPVARSAFCAVFPVIITILSRK